MWGVASPLRGAFALAVLICAACQAVPPLPLGAPAGNGLSPAGIERLHEFMEGVTHSGIKG